MKAILAGLASLVLGVSVSNGAFAQEQIPSPQFVQAHEMESRRMPEPYAAGYGRGWASPRGWGGYRYGARVEHPWHAEPWHGGRFAYPRAVGRGGHGHYAHRR